jgi:hypothetical protein
MAGSDIGLLLEILFLGFACGAFFIMLHLLGTPNEPHDKLLRIIHRTAGGIAVALYAVIAIMCIGDLHRGGGLSAVMAVCFAFGSLFVPMILMKIVIVEKYPELRNRLFGIGTVIFASVFVIFFALVSSHIGERTERDMADGESTTSMDLDLGKDLFVVKCAKCHRLDRALSARMSASEWERTVESMRQKDLSWISESEAAKITDFLTSLGD